jgi:hypothetical protein
MGKNETKMKIMTYCLNGHYIGQKSSIPRARTSLEVQRYLDRGEDPEPSLPAFCPTCGAKNINKCQSCKAPIEYYRETNMYCGGCGKAFPWTEAALRSAKEFTDELQELSTEQKQILKQTFDDLVVDTPRTSLAASRFKRIVDTLAPAAKDILTKIVVEVATQAAKTGMGL